MSINNTVRFAEQRDKQPVDTGSSKILNDMCTILLLKFAESKRPHVNRRTCCRHPCDCYVLSIHLTTSIHLNFVGFKKKRRFELHDGDYPYVESAHSRRGGLGAG